MSDPLLSIIIPAYNEELLLGAAIKSAHYAAREAGLEQWEVVVCDNNSRDRTAEVAREHGARVVFEPHNQIALARNRGAAEAEGEWLIFLDADSRLSPELLCATLAKFRSGRVGAGGALVHFDSEDLGFEARAGVVTWNFLSRTLKFAAGSYIYCLREAWSETGGFDERYYAGEELGFSRLLNKWCMKRGLRFEIIKSAPIETSARKIENRTFRQVLSMVLPLFWPGSLRMRERCIFWYRRDPEKPPAEKG